MKRYQVVFAAIATLIVGIAVSQPAAAQVLYGSIVGSVSDATGAIVPGATVNVTNTNTNATRDTRTDAGGRYTISNVQAGTYDLKVSSSGFRAQVRTGVAVTINSVTRMDFVMEVGQVTEQVTVEASALVLQTDKSDVHVELSTKEIAQLPLAKYRNYQSLINLVPGATPGRFQNANTDTPARALTTNINGTNRNNNNTKLDGAANVFVWLPHHTVYVAPAESIETVNISTNNFDAEQGLAGGAAITVSTKSGTNDLHGSAFMFHENSKWGAKNFFFRDPKTPKSLVTIPGFTIGGPIKKDKLFFFGDWEGLRERVNRNRQLTVAPADMRAGNFSAYNFNIFDPLTGNPDGSGRTPFANKIVPMSRHSATMRRLQDMVPASNFGAGQTATGTGGANFFNADSQVMDRDNADVKINYNRTQKHMIWGKYSRMSAVVTGQPALGQAIGTCLCDGGIGTGDTAVQLATIGQTYTISPTFLFDTTVGFSRLGHFTTGPDFGQNIGLDVLRIPGTNGPDPRQGGFPIFNISGFDSLGNINGWSPAFRNDQSWTVDQNFSKLHGAHELRFGYNGVRHLLNHWQPELGAGPRGTIGYSNQTTGAAGQTVGQSNAWASFLLGLPNSMGKSVQFIKMNVQEYQHGFYFRDRWQVNRMLTLNLGVRYELFPLFTRAGAGGIEKYDPTNNTVLLGNLGGNSTHLGVGTSKGLFAPRVGLAFRVNDDTVIRTGYGITYNPMPLARPLRGFYPLTVSQNFVPTSTAAGFNPSFAFFRPVEQGIPEVPLPDISSGRIPLPVTADMRTIDTDSLVRGYIQSWNFFIQRKAPGGFFLDIGYVGTRTVHSFGDLNGNAAAAGAGQAGQPLFAQFRRAISILNWNGRMNAHYHGLQVAVNRKVANGLFLKGAYTYSKAMNQTDDDGWAGVSWNHPEVYARNYAQAGYNIPHMFQLGYAYDLPFGKGKQFANSSAVAHHILGNWTLNGGTSLIQGRPFTVGSPGGDLNAPGNTQTADQVSSVSKVGDLNEFYRKSSFSQPRDRGRYGTTGRNLLRGPGIVNFDVSLFKGIPISEGHKLEFRAEAFNFANTPHFNNPNADVSSGNFMRILGADATQRTIRFGLRYSF
ncbi:MAG: hypothetical protein FJW20_03350 [Acidimicrobiia bacterium]|nr:hypothetical protein [Acidimicrobiia bacterium]